MTIRQWDRREELRGELLDLIVEMMALGRTAEGQNTPEFRRLDQELTEKTPSWRRSTPCATIPTSSGS